MADDKIVHRVSLEGVDDVAKKLKNIGWRMASEI
jgi:hypothetical protein